MAARAAACLAASQRACAGSSAFGMAYDRVGDDSNGIDQLDAFLLILVDRLGHTRRFHSVP